MNLIRQRPVVVGAVGGLLWGGVLRGWMRYISDSPEFSWSGTGFILGASLIVGSLLGLARRRRQAGGVGWWRLSAMSLMLLGAGGAVMWPSVVLGGVAIGRRRPSWLRVSLGLAAVGAQVPVLGAAIYDSDSMSTGAMALATIWYVPMLAIEAWAFSVVFAPSVAGAPVPGRVQKILIAAPLTAMAVMSAVVVGVPGM